MKDKINPPAYITAVREAMRKNPPRPGSVHRVEVRHDEWCDQYRGIGPCNCNFEVVVCGELQ